jgi:hypothetical protein
VRAWWLSLYMSCSSGDLFGVVIPEAGEKRYMEGHYFI